MIPHGPYHPPAIDPAEYTHRALLAGADPEASTLILWFDTDPGPFDADLLAAIEATSAANGHFLIMAKCPTVLDAAHDAIVRLHHAAEGCA
ncbi:MAG: hypothetical protein AB7O80_17100 [Acetobacteraceae bacterium]